MIGRVALMIGRVAVCASAALSLQLLVQAGSVRAASSADATLTVNTPVRVLWLTLSRSGTLALMDADRRLRLLNLANGRELRSLMLPASSTAVTISDDARWLAVTSRAGLVTMLDASTGVQQFQAQLAAKPRSPLCVFSHHGAYLAVIDNGEGVRVFGRDGRQRFFTTASAGGAIAVAFSPDDASMAVVDNDGTIRIFSTADGRIVAENDDLALETFGADFTPDGRQLVLGGAYGSIVFLDARSAAILRRVAVADGVPWFGLAFAPSGKTLLVPAVNPDDLTAFHVAFVDPSTGTHLADWKPPGPAATLGWTRDGRWWVASFGEHELRISPAYGERRRKAVNTVATP